MIRALFAVLLVVGTDMSTITAQSNTNASSSTGTSGACAAASACPELVFCAGFNFTRPFPTFATHASGSPVADQSRCGTAVADIGNIAMSYTPSDQCQSQVLALMCQWATSQAGDCNFNWASNGYVSACSTAMQCLTTEGQQFVNQTGLCTNMQMFLDRPPVSSSSTGSSGGGGNGARGQYSFVSVAALLVVTATLFASTMVME